MINENLGTIGVTFTAKYDSLNKAEKESAKIMQAMASNIERLEKEFKKSSKGVERFSEKASKEFKDLRKDIIQETNKSKNAIVSLTQAFSVIGTVYIGKELLQTADNFNALTIRIKTATKETADFHQVYQSLYDITQTTGSNFGANVSLFQGLARSRKELGATNTEILKLTKTFNQLGTISGASTESMKNGLLQFNQAMAGGIMRAEEYNSIIENIPEVANRIAKGFNVTKGQLRQLMLDGKLLSKDIFKVLLSQAQEIDTQFKETPKTMARGWNELTTSFSKFLSGLDKAVGFTTTLANLFSKIAGFLDDSKENIKEITLPKLQGSMWSGNLAKQIFDQERKKIFASNQPMKNKLILLDQAKIK